MNASDQLLLKTRDAAEELKTGIHMVIILVSYLFTILYKGKFISFSKILEFVR